VCQTGGHRLTPLLDRSESERGSRTPPEPGSGALAGSGTTCGWGASRTPACRPDRDPGPSGDPLAWVASPLAQTLVPMNLHNAGFLGDGSISRMRLGSSNTRRCHPVTKKVNLSDRNSLTFFIRRISRPVGTALAHVVAHRHSRWPFCLPESRHCLFCCGGTILTTPLHPC